MMPRINQTDQMMGGQQTGGSMPLPVDNLTPDSGDGTIRQAISASIAACMREPIPEGYDVTAANKNKWCAAKAYSIAREKSGKELSEGTIK